MAIGMAVIDFGDRATDARAIVTGQAAIGANSFVEAWIFPGETPTNTVDNHWVDDLDVVAGNIVPGVGFTIYAKCKTGLAHGAFRIAWVWS